MTNNILGIDDHYINYPSNAWGHTDLNNVDMIKCFTEVADSVNPVNVIEIGMFAGHSTLVMLNAFKNIKRLDSYDPSPVSAANARQIKKFYPQFNFYQSPLQNNEHLYSNTDIDLIYVDGAHLHPGPMLDTISTLKINPRYALYDNLEHADVKKEFNKHGFFEQQCDPKFWFYVNTHKGKTKPGIFALVKIRDA